MVPLLGRKRRSRRGSALIATLFFILVMSVLMMGMGSFTVSHMARAQADADYARALDLAEAGANYEFNKISTTPNAAGTAASPDSAPGSLGLSPIGTFRAYCVARNADGSDGGNWTAPNRLYVYSTGIVNLGKSNEVRRTIKVAAKGYGSGGSANYAVFGVAEGIINGTPTFVQGDVGTNGFFTFNGQPGVQGSVVFNGPTSNWQSPPQKTYNVVHNDTPVTWPTVDQLAVAAFGSAGLSWLSAPAHNDNSLCSAISNNQILLNSGTATFKGKAGGANYYLTSILLNGNSTLYFDNTNGPINIWIGPSGGWGNNFFNGCSAAIKMSNDATKAVKVYVANNSDVILNGNTELDAGIYAYNGPNSGRVIFNGSPDIYGPVISNKFTFNGNPAVRYVPGFFNQPSTGVGYYGYDDLWSEVGGR